MIMKCQVCGKEHEINVVSRIEKVKTTNREYNIRVMTYDCKGKDWMVANVIPDDGETLEHVMKEYLRDFGQYLQDVVKE